MKQSLTFDVWENSKGLQHPLLRSWSSRDECCYITYTSSSLYLFLLCNILKSWILQCEEKTQKPPFKYGVSPFLHLRVGGLFSYASTGAELCQQLKQLCVPIVNAEYLRCTSQWNAKRKKLEKDRGTMRSWVRIFCS